MLQFRQDSEHNNKEEEKAIFAIFICNIYLELKEEYQKDTQHN